MTHKDLKEKALKRKGVETKYRTLEPEFTLLRAMLQVRQKAGLTQAQIAE